MIERFKEIEVKFHQGGAYLFFIATPVHGFILYSWIISEYAFRISGVPLTIQLMIGISMIFVIYSLWSLIKHFKCRFTHIQYDSNEVFKFLHLGREKFRFSLRELPSVIFYPDKNRYLVTVDREGYFRFWLNDIEKNHELIMLCKNKARIVS